MKQHNYRKLGWIQHHSLNCFSIRKIIQDRTNDLGRVIYRKRKRKKFCCSNVQSGRTTVAMMPSAASLFSKISWLKPNYKDRSTKQLARPNL